MTRYPGDAHIKDVKYSGLYSEAGFNPNLGVGMV